MAKLQNHSGSNSLYPLFTLLYFTFGGSTRSRHNALNFGETKRRTRKSVVLSNELISENMTGSMLLFIGIFIIALFVLVKASDWFVDAAEVVGLSFGISPFIVGVTIIAFGTSLPELATSVAAVLENDSDIVIGNVIGSNITNILLVLSLTTIVGRGIIMDYDVMDIDMPLLLGSAVLLFFISSDGIISRFEGVLLIIGLVIFLINSLKGNEREDKSNRTKVGLKTYTMLLVGGVLVWLGADYTIYAIQGLSAELGIQSGVIAQTAVALGTSLPEVIVSITAARKGKTAIAVGNVLGSNIFNTYAVIAIPSFISPLIVSDSMRTFGLPFMFGVTIIFAIVSLSKRISKWEGAMLLVFYIYYLKEVVLSNMA